VVSSTHSSPSSFASKCVTYSNMSLVDRCAIGGPCRNRAFGRRVVSSESHV